MKKNYQNLEGLPLRAPVSGKGIDVVLGMITPHLIGSLRGDIIGLEEDQPAT